MRLHSRSVQPSVKSDHCYAPPPQKTASKRKDLPTNAALLKYAEERSAPAESRRQAADRKSQKNPPKTGMTKGRNIYDQKEASNHSRHAIGRHHQLALCPSVAQPPRGAALPAPGGCCWCPRAANRAVTLCLICSALTQTCMAVALSCCCEG